jgi:hypothetical protein
MHHPQFFSDVHPDLIVAGFSIVLALVQILWAAAARTNELGLKWNVGPRDGEVDPPGVVAGRLMRAQIWRTSRATCRCGARTFSCWVASSICRSIGSA